jgi:PKD repeat protein
VDHVLRQAGAATAKAKALVVAAAILAAVATTSAVIIGNSDSATTPNQPPALAGIPGATSPAGPGSSSPIVASAAATPAAASYACGATRPQVTATGTLTVDSPKTVTYQWQRDDNSVVGPFTVDVLASGTPVTADTFTPGADSGTDTLQILSPSVTSAPAAYSLTCATQGPASTVSARAVPAAARYVCGTGRPKVTADGSIAVVTPGSVTYQWQRSDGSVAGPFTLDAETAPKAVASDTFTPAADTGSDALQILTPTTAAATATYQVACDPPPGSVTVAVTAHAAPAAATYMCGATRPQVKAMGTLTASTPGKVTYQWRRDDGSVAGPFSLTAPGTPTPATVSGDTFTPTADSGADTLQILTPTAASAKASFTVTCTQPSPTQQLTLKASATPSAPSYTCGTQRPQVTATGTIAAAASGTVSYQWVRDDGSVAGPYTLAAGTTPGAVTADTFTPAADAGSDTLQVLAPSPAATKAAFTLTCTPPVVVTPALTLQNVSGHVVTADASSSTVSGGTIADYAFDFGDGTVVGPQSVATANHTYAQPGTHTVTVTVRTTSGAKATTSATVNVAALPPTAHLTLSKSTTATGAPAITCDAGASTAGDSPIASYTFTFSDQSPSVTQPGSTLVHSASRGVSYTVTVTVKDAAGNMSAPVSQNITV